MNNYLILVPLAMTFLFILFTSNQFSSHNNPLSSIMYCQQQSTMKCDRLFRTLCPGRLDIVDNNIVGFTEHCSGLSDILCPTIWSHCVTLDTCVVPCPVEICETAQMLKTNLTRKTWM